MAQATSDDGETERCRAIVSDGDRCSRPAGEDGFCYQHGPEDETVDEASDGDGGQSAAEESGDVEDAGPSGGDSSGGGDGSASSDSDQSAGGSESFDIADVRETAAELSETLIGHPFDGVIEVERVDGGWHAVVEVIERRSVPDTQDIIGRYEVELDEDGAATGYRLTDRYRRGDTSGDPVE